MAGRSPRAKELPSGSRERSIEVVGEGRRAEADDGLDRRRESRPVPARRGRRCVPLMCEPRLGLTSDYQSAQPAPPPHVQPYPEGRPGGHGQPARRTHRNSVAGDRPNGRLRRASPRTGSPRRKKQPSMRSPHGNTPFAGTTVAKCRLSSRAMYRAPMDEARVDGVLRRGDQEIPAWAGRRRLRTGDISERMGDRRTGREANGEADARVTYCDRRGVTYMLPLGLIQAHGRTYWAYQLSGLRPRRVRDRASHAESRHAGECIIGGSCPIYRAVALVTASRV